MYTTGGIVIVCVWTSSVGGHWAGLVDIYTDLSLGLQYTQG
jgi:hypothetical protein